MQIARSSPEQTVQKNSDLKTHQSPKVMAPHWKQRKCVQTMNNVRDVTAMFRNLGSEGCIGTRYWEETGASGDCRAF